VEQYNKNIIHIAFLQTSKRRTHTTRWQNHHNWGWRTCPTSKDCF